MKCCFFYFPIVFWKMFITLQASLRVSFFHKYSHKQLVLVGRFFSVTPLLKIITPTKTIQGLHLIV